jgi:hypothetical protein
MKNLFRFPNIIRWLDSPNQDRENDLESKTPKSKKRSRAVIISCKMAVLLMLVGFAPHGNSSASAAEIGQAIAQTNSASPTYQSKSEASPTYEGNIGYLPDGYGGNNLTEAEKRGRQTWYYWTGGNQKFFRDFAKLTHGEADLLSLADARPDSALFPGDKHHYQRNERFKSIGVINDPGCKAATKPDKYGFWLDNCDKDLQAAGIMGVRKFPNPDFDPAKWDIAQYYQTGDARAKIEPPYKLGLSCGVCHIAFDPTKPPRDPENPRWENLASAIGNQYLREGSLFGGNIPDEDFRKQVLNTQPPGTSDTSRIATDHINNPNAINAIFNLKDRVAIASEEVMNDGKTQKVPHILKDGADSVGVPLASLRVYVNIGMCSEQWLKNHDAVLGRTAQKPFSIDRARKECEGWQQTEPRMADAEAFLSTLTPLSLADAPGGKSYLTKDKSVLERGKIAFADTCATCHSSKQPPAEIAANPETAKQWYRESVLNSNFLDNNFLSDDKRYPVTLLGTNSSRALATNATKGQIWDDFSSKTYKNLPSPGTLKLTNPFDKDKAIDFKVPAGGRGYYRTPSLISLWSSAPFLHNNQLGKYTADPSVKGRIEAFNDATEKLLWPEKREGIVWRTDRETNLALGDKFETSVPKGAPINLLANLDPRNVPSILTRKMNSEVGSKVLESLVDIVPDRKLANLLLKTNKVPDFVEDRGHEFGKELPDEDKRALIEFLKTF